LNPSKEVVREEDSIMYPLISSTFIDFTEFVRTQKVPLSTIYQEGVLRINPKIRDFEVSLEESKDAMDFRN